jgi:hypothetical protein
MFWHVIGMLLAGQWHRLALGWRRPNSTTLCNNLELLAGGGSIRRCDPSSARSTGNNFHIAILPTDVKRIGERLRPNRPEKSFTYR